MKYIWTILLVIILGIGVYIFFSGNAEAPQKAGETQETSEQENGATSTETQSNETDQNEDDESEDEENGMEVIGTSVEDRDITAYHYGDGSDELLFVGGIHGGYSWNTTLVAYELMDYLEENPNVIPNNVRVTVIPVLNPDGLYQTVGTADRFESSDVPNDQSTRVAGRFNANEVDLNRNFACEWQTTAVWRDQEVDAGDEAFSEPETQAFRDYVESNEPSAVVVWFSASGDVVASSCGDDRLFESQELVNLYAKASGYTARESFDYYETTGDVTNWLAKIGVPAISVVLDTHDSVEWEKNKKGITELLKEYAD